MKNVVILGSTGSIGINALKVIDRFPNKFQIFALSAYNNFKLLEKQIGQYTPRYVAVTLKGIEYLKDRINLRKTKILDVQSDLSYIVTRPQANLIVIAMRGSAALEPFLSAVRCGKMIAPANKEALVVAGDIIMEEARKHNASIIPIDSEQSAIFQCLKGHRHEELKRIYLTASGGVLRNIPQSRFDKMSLEEILNHPRWKMGRKITVDSATLMNKGFEVIEAKHLFKFNIENIEVLIHPEAVIHSMVEFQDGSIIAQLGITDMRLPIQYALTYPDRLDTGLTEMNFLEVKKLTFEKPNFKKFPSLALAFYAGEKGGSLPCVLNAADEEAVEAFLNRQLRFSSIYKVVEKVVLKHKIIKKPTLKDIQATDIWARQEAKKLIFN